MDLTYASCIAFSINRAVNGVDGDNFKRIGFPSNKGASADLKVSQTGKFQGKITEKQIVKDSIQGEAFSAYLELVPEAEQ